MRNIVLAILASLAIATGAYAYHDGNQGNDHGSQGKDHRGQGGHDSAQNQDHPPKIIAFGRMYGVDGPFTKEANTIRGIIGDEDPWVVGSAHGRLDIEGRLQIHVRGLVFGEGAAPDKVGTNDEPTFRGAVSCLTEESEDEVGTAEVVTEGFPATDTGDSDIDAHVDLPNPCVAPIVFVLAGSEDKWFAVTGFESKGD